MSGGHCSHPAMSKNTIPKLLGYDQSGHIPNANPNDPGDILWSGKHRSNAGRNGTIWFAPGFGPGTFGLCEVSRVPGEDSPIGWTLEFDRGIELGTSREIDNSYVSRGSWGLQSWGTQLRHGGDHSYDRTSPRDPAISPGSQIKWKHNDTTYGTSCIGRYDRTALSSDDVVRNT